MTAALTVLLGAATAVPPAKPNGGQAPATDGSFLDALVTLIDARPRPPQPALPGKGTADQTPNDPHEASKAHDRGTPAADAALVGPLILPLGPASPANPASPAPPTAPATSLPPPRSLLANGQAGPEVRAPGPLAPGPIAPTAATSAPEPAVPERAELPADRGFAVRGPLPQPASEPVPGKPPHVEPGITPGPLISLGPQPALQPAPQPAPAPPAPAPAAPAPAPTPQPALAAALVQLRGRPDGVSELTVELHPAELGAVQVRATLSGGTLDVTVACADETARHAVTAALPALHTQLDALGSLEVQLTNGQDRLSDAPPHQHQRREPEQRPQRRDRQHHDERFEEWM